MYLIIQNDRVVKTFWSREGAEAYASNNQIVIHTSRKDAKPGDRASKFRK